MRKKKHVVGAIVCTAMLLLESVSAFAAPKTMADGAVFDSEYYAAANPDVVAKFGSSESALYKHYKGWGQKEGRFPVDPVLIAYALSQGGSAAAATSTDTSAQSAAVATQTKTDNTQKSVDINDGDAVMGELLNVYAANSGYKLINISGDGATVKASSFVFVDLQASNGKYYRISYGPKGSVNARLSDGTAVPAHRLALVIYNDDGSQSIDYKVANTVEEMGALLAAYAK